MPFGVSQEARDQIRSDIRMYCHGVLENPLRSEYVSVNEISKKVNPSHDDISETEIKRIAGNMMGQESWAEKQSNLNWRLTGDPINR